MKSLSLLIFLTAAFMLLPIIRPVSDAVSFRYSLGSPGTSTLQISRKHLESTPVLEYDANSSPNWQGLWKYFLDNLLVFGILIAYAVLIFTFILVVFYGVTRSLALVLFILVFAVPLVFFFVLLFVILLLLLASLLSGFSLLYKSRKRLLDLVLFALFLILVFVFPSITLNASIVPFAVFVGRIVLFWGVIEAARDYIYPIMTKVNERHQTSLDSSGSKALAKTATVSLVALFGLSIFAQDITGQNLLYLGAEILPDYAFIAGAVLAVLTFIVYKAKQLIQGT